MTTVPLIVEVIFRFIPSTLIIFLPIDACLTPKYNKYIQMSIVSFIYMCAGVFGQYMREMHNMQVVDFTLAVAIVLCYSIFFHTDSIGYRVFIGSLVYLSVIIFDTIFSSLIFVLFPDFSFDIGHMTYASLLAADIDLMIYAILMYIEYCIVR